MLVSDYLRVNAGHSGARRPVGPKHYDGMVSSHASLIDLLQSKSSAQVLRRKELGMVSLIRLQLKRVLRWQASIALASLACSALRWIQ